MLTIVQTNSEAETLALAERLASLLKSGDIITLEGQLGAGKTVFAKGIASGLHVSETVTSPTFTIIKEYNGIYPFYHMDAYRLEHSEEDIGFSEYFDGDGVVVVEWAQFIEEFLPDERLDIEINYIDEQTRKITFHATGSYYKDIVERLLNKTS